MRIRLLTLTLLSLLVVPAAAQASPRQVMSFEAPTELLDYSRVDATLREIRAFGVTQVRQLVYWQDFAPRPNGKTKPGINLANPDAYPTGTWGRLDLLIARANANGIKVMLTRPGPVPKGPAAAKKGLLTRPRAKLYGQFVTALPRRYGTSVDM